MDKGSLDGEMEGNMKAIGIRENNMEQVYTGMVGGKKKEALGQMERGLAG